MNDQQPKPVFLTAEWRKLLMANYAIDPAILKPLIPYKTELDLWNNTCYVSLVGFMFLNTRLKGFAIPGHQHFEEVNLRFYVRYRDGDTWKRGVVFIKEIVPKPALTFVANTIYGEPYETMTMRHLWEREGSDLHVRYAWYKKRWHAFQATADAQAQALVSGSEPEFITEHYWGYTYRGPSRTSEYAVEHPRWDIYPVKKYQVDVQFGQVYGDRFAALTQLTPASVFLAEGSPIIVRGGRMV